MSESAAPAQSSPIDVGFEAATAINAFSHVVGASGGRAFLYTDGALLDLSNIPSNGPAQCPCPTQAWGINNAGQIIGLALVQPSADIPQFFQRAFLRSAGQTFDLGTFGGNTSGARGINELGQVVGFADTPTGRQHAFVFSGTQTGLVDLGTFGGESSAAIAINNNGQVVGWAEIPSNTATHPFKWEGASLIDLAPTLPPGVSAEAYGVNDTGDAVGALYLPNHIRHAALWTNGEMKDLGTLGGDVGEAYGIDAAGHIVGTASTAANMSAHAFLYSQGKMFDLNSVLPLNSGWELRNAYAINDAGDVVGYGFHNGLARGFVLHLDLNRPNSSCALSASSAQQLAQSAAAVSCTCSGPQPGGIGWPRDATVKVYIDPQFTITEAAAIKEAFIAWSVENLRNGAGVEFIFEEQPVSGNLTHRVLKGATAEVVTTPAFAGDGRTVLAAVTTTDPFMPAYVLTGAMAHEIGHLFNLDHCSGCAEGTTVMRGVDLINGQYYLRGSTHPTRCDNIVVEQFYSLTVFIQ